MLLTQIEIELFDFAVICRCSFFTWCTQNSLFLSSSHLAFHQVMLCLSRREDKKNNNRNSWWMTITVAKTIATLHNKLQIERLMEWIFFVCWLIDFVRYFRHSTEKSNGIRNTKKKSTGTEMEGRREKPLR